MTSRRSEFAEVYDRYAKDVYRFALRLSGERADAEDIASEAFVRAFTSASPVRAATVRAYLFTIARNYYLELLRNQARHVPLVDSIEDTAPETHKRAEGRSELGAVAARLCRLPEIDRAAVILRAEHELSYEEIARILEISVAAAKVKVHRARLALASLR